MIAYGDRGPDGRAVGIALAASMVDDEALCRDGSADERSDDQLHDSDMEFIAPESPSIDLTASSSDDEFITTAASRSSKRRRILYSDDEDEMSE
jgi:hypothetical protein